MRNKKEQSDTHRYKSPLTGEFVQAHQYIGEVMTDRLAKKDGKNLPYKYWLTDPKWSKTLKNQITASGKLLKIYSAKAIIKTIEVNSWCYSIHYLKDKIVEQQAKLDAETNTVEIKEKSTDIYIHQPRKRGLLGKINGESKRED